MTTPLDPYASASSNLPSAVQSQIPGNIIGANNQTINTSELNVSSSGGGAVYGYAGTPGLGNLTFSLSSASGTDAFGNTVPTGINVNSGSIVGVSLTGVQVDATSTLQGSQLNQPSVLNPTVAGGTAASLVHTMTNNAGGVYGYASSTASTTFATNGNYLWTAPTGITSVNIECWGAGAGGGGGSNVQGGESGGGGEYAQEPQFSVTPGAVYAIVVGQGAQGGATGNAGSPGGQTTFQNQQGGGSSVIANPGLAGIDFVGGVGGSGSSNSIHFDGGNGANASGNTGGAGGGGSGSYSGQGNAGNQSITTTGAGGAAAIAGGGAGGGGGNAAANGSNGGSPGGGGGGAGANSVVNASKTYPAADPGGTYAYRGSDATTSPNAQLNHDGPCFQGFPNASYGTQYSYFILPWAQIQSDMSGLNITSVSIKFKCLYAYYSSGVYAHIYYTSLDSFGGTGNRTAGSPTYVGNYLIKENATITQNVGLNGGIGAALQSGAAKSIQFSSIPLTPAGDYYGSFDSGANNGVVPGLVVYYNNGGGSTAGTGSDGQVVLSYQSGTVPTFQLSVSATASADVFGNPFNQGFTGNQLTVLGSQAPSTTPTAVSNTSPTSAAVAANTAGQVITTNAVGFTGTLPATQVDIAQNSNNNNGTIPTNISRGWLIPAGDAQVGTLYSIEIPFGGTFEGETVTWGVNINGAGTHADTTIGGAFFNAGTVYLGNIRGKMQVITTGTAGTANFFTDGGIGINGNRSSGSNCNDAYLSGLQSGVAFNTTVANTISVFAQFGGAATSQIITGYGSLFNRFGP